VPPPSPAYIPDPIELDKHVPVYVLEPEQPKYHVPTDDDIQVEDQPYANDASSTAKSPGHIDDAESMEEDSIDYPNEPEDGDEDLEEDPEEDHTLANGEDGDDEPSDDDNDNDDTNDEDEEPNEDEEEEEHIASTDSFALPVVDPIPLVGDTKAFETDEAWKTVKLEPHMSAFMEARIVEHAAAPIPPTSSAYDQASLAESSAAFAAIPPRGQYDFVDTIEAGQGLIRSPGHDGWTIARVADIVEDVGYVRALQASKRRMMTSIKEVNLRLLDARTNHRDIRLKIDVVRGKRTAYETELHEVCQAYLSSEAQTRALLARLETLETHMSHME
ncbi:hypothetical protein Tco_1419022, partial [Tanacetum coccineum]